MGTIIVATISFLINIPLGKYRAKYLPKSFMWWVMIHASIPLIVFLRILLDTPTAFIPLFIGAAIAGQFIGKKLTTPK
ncbi:MAG: hypothetical protein LBU44_08290 [Mediterranea sp.]|jgi:uncharacterized membrane-anchored protein YitT (DUF2179 family)|nr:hypothetical protein [Mediterranea sp.]